MIGDNSTNPDFMLKILHQELPPQDIHGGLGTGLDASIPYQEDAPVTIPPDFRFPFPQVIDSTTIAAFRSCPQKAFRQYFQHWKPQGESVHLIAGGAFAAGLEAARTAYYADGWDMSSAEAMGIKALVEKYGDFQCPEDSVKSLERMVGALEYYFTRYPLDTDPAKPAKFTNGRLGIELSFSEPLPVAHPVTGNPILFAGRSDMVCEFAGGIYIEDDKTTSQLGATWSKQWDLRSQFTGYCWAARQSNIPVTGVLVRGVSILKTKYDTQQALTYRANWEMDRWLAQVVRDIERMKVAWETGYWDYALDEACTQYGGCSLQRVCKSESPDTWLPMYFTPRVWNPLLREEETLGTYLIRAHESGALSDSEFQDFCDHNPGSVG